MKNVGKNIVKKTNGKKTESVGMLMMLFQAFLLVFPSAVEANVEDAIEMILASGIIPTLFHRYWRNRIEVNKFVSGIFKHKKP